VKLVLVAAALAVVALGGGLWWTLRGDAAPQAATPFDSGDLGHGLVACKSLCARQTHCGVVPVGESDCAKDCEDLVGMRAGAPTCAREVTDMLACWSRATDRCAPEDACAAEVGTAFACACKLPHPPSSCPK
jgi:hypothetical protein